MKNNSRKIFDIIPPGKISEEKNISSFNGEGIFNSFFENGEKEGFISLAPPAPQKPAKKKRWLALIFIVVVAAGFFGSYFASRAEVEIWPKGELLELNETFKIDPDQKEVDFDKKIVPGKTFEVADIFSEEFSSSGRIFKKSEGIIRLYNNYSANQEVWRAGTRFVSSEGKLFLSKDKIIVPGAEIKNGKIFSKWVDVPIAAAEPGSSYNIKPSHFSVIAYLGTERYTKFYGESFEAIKGGGEANAVSGEDIEKAEKILTETAIKRNEQNLREKIARGFIFLEGAQKTEILEAKPLAKAGEELEKFKFQIDIKSVAMAFSREDGNNLAGRIIALKIGEGRDPEKSDLWQKKKPKEDTVRIKYEIKEFDKESGALSANLNLSAKIYPEISEAALKDFVRGKKTTEVRNLLRGFSFAEKADFRVWPFWIRKIPEDKNKIKVKINFL